MRDAHPVGVAQGVGDGGRELDGLAPGVGAVLAEALLEGGADQEVHHQVGPPGVEPDAVDAHDPRVPQPRQ